MDNDAFVQQVVNLESPHFPDNLTLANARVLANCLKAENERQLRIDPNLALHCGEELIRLGESVDDLRIRALGAMARGDALGVMHRSSETWEMYTLAGDLCKQAGDEVGWARTCIGKVFYSVEMNSVESAFRDAEIAREIFLRHGELDKIVRLDTNTAVTLNYLSEFHAAIDKCQTVLKFIEENEGFDHSKFSVLYYALGHANQGLGNMRESLIWYERSREIMAANNEKHGVAFIDLNIINVAQAQGHHKKALQRLHQTIDVLAQNLGGKEMMHVIQGYLFLNRFNEARELAHKVIEHQTHGDNFDSAMTLLQLGQAEAALGDFEQALQNLQRAEHIFAELNAVAWLGTVDLYRGQIAFRQKDIATARDAARAAAERSQQSGQQVTYLTALLLLTRVEIADERFETAVQVAQTVQKLTQQLHVPHLRYESHLLLGKIAEQRTKSERAIRHYQIATGIMERIQRSLVLTARAEFLADKQDSVRALVRLNLELGRTEAAFAALERAKAQVWLGYLSQLDHLRWLRESPQTQALIDELTQVREEHHWYYRAAHDQVFREQQHITLPSTEAALEASARERRLSTLTEQLYLHSNIEDLAATAVVSVSAIQECLSDDSRLLAYYNDGQHLWAFLLTSASLDVCLLPEPIAVIENLVDKWQTNINRTLRTAPGSTEERMLSNYALPLLKRLYDALLRPFAGQLDVCQRLLIVPYGALHYLPFQLLHDGDCYVIEKQEVVILPTASLITRQAPRQKRKALALSYNWDGRLQYTGDEAGRVVDRFGGRRYSENQATQAILNTPPCQVLHISAHGEYRIDQPDFSYIQLADGPLYTDDLFQHDLGYELVTLSACETGRSRAAAGDELIGLGRGFLFAGAGALIASLWRVNETFTLELMDELYHQLDSGASKAAALRAAQLTLVRDYPGLHPAFWGAFELIGNADPLTTLN
jgi:CHAT domain-containing protein